MENYNEEIKKIFDGINLTLNNKTCVGEPIVVNDTTIIPLVEMTMGAGIGEFSTKENNTAGGFGAKVSPVACLIIRNGFTKLINIKNQDALSKALDIVPDIIDKLTGKNVIEEDIKNKIDEIDEEYIDDI